MPKAILLLLGMCLSLTSLPTQGDIGQNSLEILSSEDSFPFSYVENGQPKGFDNEIVQALQEHLKNKNEISMVPWTRAYHHLQVKPNVVFTSVSRTKEREQLFYMVGPLTTKAIVFYKKKNSPLEIKSLEDALKVKRIAVRRNTIYEKILRQKGFKDLILTENILQNQRLLEGNRVDLFLDAEVQSLEIFTKETLALKSIQKAYVLMNLDTYIAFSKGTPPQIIEDWRIALQKIKANGTFEKIYRKWMPEGKIPMSVEATHPRDI